MIPKIIHQIYWDFSNENKPPKLKWKESSDNLREQHPKWKYYQWNLEDATELVENHYSYLLNKWNKFSNIEKCDVLRPILMYHFGGVYCDMDIKLVPGKTFDELINKGDTIILAKSNQSGFIIEPVINSFMMSEPNLLFWKLYIDRINNVYIPSILPKNFRIFYLAGPLALSLHYRSHKNMATLYDSEYFDVKSMDEITNNTYIIHYGDTSWNSNEDRNECYDFIILLIMFLIFIILLIIFLVLYFYNYI